METFSVDLSGDLMFNGTNNGSSIIFEYSLMADGGGYLSIIFMKKASPLSISVKNSSVLLDRGER